MLKINLLSMKFDAEREYRKMLAGQVCNYLTMLEDDQVGNRVKVKVKHQRIEAKVAHQMLSRRGMSAVGSTFLGANGEPNRDVLKPTKPAGKDKVQRFSRCLHCNTEFIDERGRPTPSSFAFCGETSLEAGDCKRAWLATRPEVKREPKFTVVTREDVDWTKRQPSMRKGLRKARANYCPTCREYVTQAHEHQQ